MKQLSKSRETWIRVVYEALKLLKENWWQLSSKEVTEKVWEKLRSSFSEWEKFQYEKTGYIRWQSLLHFFSIDYQKAWFLIKRKWIWILTEEWEKMMKDGPEKLFEKANIAYKERAKNNIDKKTDTIEVTNDQEEITIEQQQQINLDELEWRAFEWLKTFVSTKNPYEFQELVAALLRAMWYFTPFIAPKWKDGWVDIIAYQDPLGAKTPRIKVQVKHYPENPISATVIRELRWLLNKESDVGIVVTSGKFTPDAEKEARSGHVHVELIDFPKLIELWKGFYNKLTDEEKNMLPLYSIYFLWVN